MRFALFLPLLASLLLASCDAPPAPDVSHPWTLQARLAELTYLDQRFDGRRTAGLLMSPVEANSRHAVEDPGEAGNLERRGAIALLRGDPELSVRHFSTGTSAVPDDARLWSDLAAAHVETIRVGGEASDLVKGLAAALQALSLEPDLRPARFNHALALSRLSLVEPARRAWISYLSLETDSRWQAEAESHLRSISTAGQAMSRQQLVQAFKAAIQAGQSREARRLVALEPQSFRELAETDLFPLWARRRTAGDLAGADEALALVAEIDRALTDAGADRWLAETLSQIERLETEHAPAIGDLIHGVIKHGEGLDLLAEDHSDLALVSFEQAEYALSAAGSPLGGVSTFRRAICLYQAYRYEEALELLGSLAQEAEHQQFRSLRGRSLLLSGLTRLVQGDPAGSLANIRPALREFEDLRESANWSKAATHLSYAYGYLGQRRKAWRWFHRALSDGYSTATIDDRIVTLVAGLWLALQQGDPRVALSLQEEVVRLARLTGKSFLIADAHRWGAEIREQLGEIEAASRDLRAARALVEEIDDRAVALEVESSLLPVEGRMLAATSVELAKSKLDRSIEILRATSYRFRLTRTLLERAHLSIKMGQGDRAEKDLEEAIAEVERQRQSILNAYDQITYFDMTRELLDTMVTLQIEVLEQPEKALEFSERAKARVLWDWLSAHPVANALTEARDLHDPLALDSFRSGLPDAALVVEYAVMPRRTVVWTLRLLEAVSNEVIEIESAILQQHIENLRQAATSNRIPEVNSSAEALYELLIRPIEKHLRPGERIIFVPDGPLHALPFGLLRNSRTSRHLIQDYLSLVTPSARILASGRRHRAPIPGHSRRVLFAVAPEFDPSIYAAEQLSEQGAAQAAISLFPGSKILRGDGATKEAFLSLAPRFDTLHFGGHSISNERYPLLSSLLFSPDGDPSRGVLYSREILKLKLPRVRLVVLASCSSGLGGISRTEGVQNLARPFLAIGIPAVIASLWNVGDKPTSEFFSLFYRHLAESSSAAQALRGAQLECLEGNTPVEMSTWSAFFLAGDG